MNRFKECSSCEALYNKSCGCSKGGFIDKFVCDPNKTPDSSQRPPHDCLKCGNPVDGLHCRQYAILRKKLNEVWFTICDEHKIFQDFLNTSDSSNDNTNVDNAPQDPFIFNQDPSKNSSQSPLHIDHHCCYGCGDSLDGIFYQRCTYESCENDAHYGYNYPPKVSIISSPKPCHNQNVDEFPQTLPNFHPTCYSGDENSFAYDSTPNFVDDSPNVFNPPLQPPTYSYEFYGNDAHYGHDCPPQVPFIYNPERFCSLRDIIIFKLPSCIAIKPILSTKGTKDSLIMGDEHLDTTPEKESDELIKSSVENLVPNPNEFEDLSDIEHSSIISSSKIDSLLDEFAGELIFLKSIPLGINEADCDPEEEIHLIKKLLYDNSTPRPLEEPNSKNFDAIIKSFSPSPILVEDSDSLIEVIDLSLTLDDSMPPGIKNDDYDSEGDILILEELLSNDSLSFPENESFHFDISSSPRPPAKPSDDDEIEPDSGSVTIKVEKSPHLLSHRGFKAFQLSSESPMMIYGGNIPILDVPFINFYPP
nr:hypothetical protein [Tanacetum cinerariifolium]